MLRRLITKFKEHPIIRNSVQISLIYAAGDLTQQTFISKVEKYDYTNTRNVAVVGGCFLSPLYVTWYTLLDKRLPGTANRIVLKKLVLDQAIGGTLGTCIFFIAMSALEKKPDIFEELKVKGPTAYAANLAYWPGYMYFIFKRVPVLYQPMAVACGDFVWSMFLCYYKMKGCHETNNTLAVLPSEETTTTSST